MKSGRLDDSQKKGDSQGTRSDHSLLLRLRAGQESAATELYLRYAHRLRALAKAHASNEVARKLEMDDLVQSVFRSFFRKAKTGLYDVPEGEDLWKLLLVMALNKIRSKGRFFRAAKRDARLTQSMAQISARLAGNKDNQFALVELQMLLDETLSQLDEIMREVVELRIAGLEVAEIAAKTGRSKRTVERLLQGFRQTLEKSMQREEES